MVALLQPIYLWVLPGHQKHWSKHCGFHGACGVPLYFVQDCWYREHVQALRGALLQGYGSRAMPAVPVIRRAPATATAKAAVATTTTAITAETTTTASIGVVMVGATGTAAGAIDPSASFWQGRQTSRCPGRQASQGSKNRTARCLPVLMSRMVAVAGTVGDLAWQRCRPTRTRSWFLIQEIDARSREGRRHRPRAPPSTQPTLPEFTFSPTSPHRASGRSPGAARALRG